MQLAARHSLHSRACPSGPACCDDDWGNVVGGVAVAAAGTGVELGVVAPPSAWALPRAPPPPLDAGSAPPASSSSSSLPQAASQATATVLQPSKLLPPRWVLQPRSGATLLPPRCCSPAGAEGFTSVLLHGWVEVVAVHPLCCAAAQSCMSQASCCSCCRPCSRGRLEKAGHMLATTSCTQQQQQQGVQKKML